MIKIIIFITALDIFFLVEKQHEKGACLNDKN